MPSIPGAPADIFADILHRLVTRDGGPGNLGQLIVVTEHAPNPAPLAAAWTTLQQASGLGQLRVKRGLRGLRLHITDSAPRPLLTGDSRDSLAAHMRSSDGFALTLGVAGGKRPGLVLTWDHRLCDARGALALVRHLAAGTAPDRSWQQRDQRWPQAVPQKLAERGPLAQPIPGLLAPLAKGHWRPPRASARGILPLSLGQAILDPSHDAGLQTAQRAATGRFGESPFLLTAVAAALHRCLGARGQILLPLAVDLRRPGDEHALINGHGFLFCSVNADLAASDFTQAAKACQAQQKAWMGAQGIEALLAGLSFFPWLPLTLIRKELGFRRPGLGASILPGLTGINVLPDQLGGAAVLGVDHVVVPPAHPGLAVLIHRDRRGLVIDVCAAAAVAETCKPSAVAAAVATVLRELACA